MEGGGFNRKTLSSLQDLVTELESWATHLGDIEAARDNQLDLKEVQKCPHSPSWDKCPAQEETTYSSYKTQGSVLKCLYCNFTVEESSAFIEHLRFHFSQQLKCSFCNFISGNISIMLLHRNTTHSSSAKPFQCFLCPYQTAVKQNLTRHQTIHTGEKRFNCRYCKYKTAYKSGLKAHESTHTGEKPFKCQLCKFSTAQGTHLKYHQRVHTGEKPFQCHLCGFSTARRLTLIQHQFLHSGERPFKCLHCNFSTAHRSSLSRHRSIYHKKEPHWNQQPVNSLSSRPVAQRNVSTPQVLTTTDLELYNDNFVMVEEEKWNCFCR
ncbi:hypothetical protein LAZ67_5000353 [Cordylochernes scorpioides]|uniref:C2H2-type domain-containing protein n=1 Tax=Cordylochernes scorpioides TaxID=51811 RepID=A0ABY6KHY0_9ARAC|nr:hypothetical protein LAZ67_5000353 [Cordylochernes scorpioides]